MSRNTFKNTTNMFYKIIFNIVIGILVFSINTAFAKNVTHKFPDTTDDNFTIDSLGNITQPYTNAYKSLFPSIHGFMYFSDRYGGPEWSLSPYTNYMTVQYNVKRYSINGCNATGDCINLNFDAFLFASMYDGSDGLIVGKRRSGCATLLTSHFNQLIYILPLVADDCLGTSSYSVENSIGPYGNIYIFLLNVSLSNFKGLHQPDGIYNFDMSRVTQNMSISGPTDDFNITATGPDKLVGTIVSYALFSSDGTDFTLRLPLSGDKADSNIHTLAYRTNASNKKFGLKLTCSDHFNAQGGNSCNLQNQRAPTLFRKYKVQYQSNYTGGVWQEVTPAADVHSASISTVSDSAEVNRPYSDLKVRVEVPQDAGFKTSGAQEHDQYTGQFTLWAVGGF